MPAWTRRRHGDVEMTHQYRLAAHAATLSRMSARIDALLVQVNRSGRDGQHLRAACTAYDQTLLIAARELGLPADLAAPLCPIDRLRLEAELTLAGLRWSHPDGWSSG